MAKRHKKKFAENVQERGKFQDKQNRRVAVDKTGTPRLPIRGLHNLGNTCYLNSVIQCLSRSPHLLQILTLPLCTKATLKRPDGSGVATLHVELIPKELPAAAQLADLALRIYHKPHESGTAAISPSTVRELVIRKYARFNGFGQHDCHEFLRALLDCLRQEELMIWRKGILDKCGFSENSSEEQRQVIRAWGRAASFATRVDRLFGGIIVSSLKCDLCHDVRTNFEFFLDLSLPIPENKIGVGHTPISNVPERGSGKSKQELKRERRKKPQKMRRKCDRARKRAELEAVRDTSSDLAVNDERADSPLKFDPSTQGTNSRSSSVVHQYDNGLRETKLAPDPTIAVNTGENETRELNGELPLSPLATNECTNQIGSCGDCNEESAVNLSDTPNNRVAEEAIANAVVENKSGLTMDLYDSQSDCADFEDSDGTEHRNPTNPSQPDSLGVDSPKNDPMSSSDTHDGVAVPEFLVEQLKQLDLDESKAANIESLLNRASRLAQIPLQSSNLSHFGVTRSAGDAVCDLYSCLSLFTAPEHLLGPNRILCPRCNKQPDEDKVRNKLRDADSAKSRDPPKLTEAVRRDLVLHPPALLTIHLKRFQQIGVHIQKSQKHVSFPIVLDLSPFCSVLYVSVSQNVQYRLYGVIEHLGRMAGGHYVAYVASQGSLTAEAEPNAATQKSAHDNAANTSGFVKRFVGQLDAPPKWPMTTHDLLQRWRRCDRDRLSESVEEAKLLVDDMLNRISRTTNEDPAASYSSTGDRVHASPEQSDPNREDKVLADTRTWFRCSDEHVDQVPVSKVLECQAYVLFYERIK